MDRDAPESSWAERLAALRRRLEELARELGQSDASGRMTPAPVPVPVRPPRG